MFALPGLDDIRVPQKLRNGIVYVVAGELNNVTQALLSKDDKATTI